MYSNSVDNAVNYFMYRQYGEQHKNKTAIYYCDLNGNVKKLSYKDLAVFINGAATILKQNNVLPEQRVALLLRDTPDFVIWFMACLQIGAVAVPLNTFFKPDIIYTCLTDSRAVLMIAHSNDRESLSEINNNNNTCTVRILYTEKEPYKDNVNPVVDIFNTHKDDSAFWLYTSGSTGSPKAAVHSHGAMVACAKQFPRSVLNISRDDICFSTSKMFFAYGLGNSILFPFAVGASCILNEGKINSEIVEFIVKKYKPTLFFSVPAVYKILLSSPSMNEDLMVEVRMCVSAGEYLPVTIFIDWKNKTNKTIFDGIGSTEAMHIFCSNSEYNVRQGTSGKAVSGYTLKIISEDGEEVEHGEIGQLIVKGKTIAKEYWHQNEKSKESFVGESLYTGDLYRQDADGFYLYEGRKNDAFKSSGLWVTPVEIEQALLNHDMIIEAAVVSNKNTEGFFVPTAFVVISKSDGLYPNELEIKDYLAMSLSKYKIPQSINILKELPKTATGKIARAELKNLQPINMVV